MHRSDRQDVLNAGLGEPVEQPVFCRSTYVARIRVADQRGEIFQPGGRRSGAATGKLWQHGRPGCGNAGIKRCRHSGFANDGGTVCCPVAPLSVSVLSERRQVGFEAEGKGCLETQFRPESFLRESRTIQKEIFRPETTRQAGQTRPITHDRPGKTEHHDRPTHPVCCRRSFAPESGAGAVSARPRFSGIGSAVFVKIPLGTPPRVVRRLVPMYRERLDVFQRIAAINRSNRGDRADEEQVGDHVFHQA